MKIKLSPKWLQQVLTSHPTQGFTRTGLLVRILIYSCVFTALGWRSYISVEGYGCPFWNRVCKTARSEARETLGAVARVQHAYRRKNLTFAGSIPKLTYMTTYSESGTTLQGETKDYTYQVLTPMMMPVQSFNQPIDSASLLEKEFIMIAQPKQPEKFVPYFIAGVFVVKDRNNEATTISAICQFKFYTRFPSGIPTLTPTKGDEGLLEYPNCPKDSR